MQLPLKYIKVLNSNGKYVLLEWMLFCKFVVEAVSTRVNSEMAILAQRILMLWPVQNTCRQTLWNQSGINLETIWNQSGINLEYE